MSPAHSLPLPAAPPTPTAPSAYDWQAMERSLSCHGNAVLPGLLTQAQCTRLAALYADSSHFRSRIIMSRHGFGRGEYQYFTYPLPPFIEKLRHALYGKLVTITNEWNGRMHGQVSYPSSLHEYLSICHEAGQERPTPLMLKYDEGDYNCLHQDIYGAHSFPLQVVILLSRPGEDFTGGEFVMTEASRKAPRAEVINLQQGDALVFTVNQRPGNAGQESGRRAAKVAMRHGVSKLHTGKRLSLGLIFHDAQ